MGDDMVVHLLGMNTKRNAPSCRVKTLLWGRTQPLAILGLKQEPDFVLGADVVYGSDPEVWDTLLETIKAFSGSSTLVVIASVCRTQCDARPFWKMVQEDFNMKFLPQSLLHPAFRGDGEGSCLVHVLRRKEGSKERKQEKEAGRGVQAAKKEEPDQSLKGVTLNSETSFKSASEREDAVVS